MTALAFTLPSCGDHAAPPRLGAHAGFVALQIQRPPYTSLDRVEYAVWGPFAQVGLFRVDPSDAGATTLTARLSLPPGFGYRIALRSFQAADLSDCSASASFDVARDVTTRVRVGLDCAEDVAQAPPAAPAAAANTCPVIEYVAASPRGGGKIDLVVTATDADRQPQPLTYRWSAPDGLGAIANPGAASTTFRCAVAGDVSIVAEVSDGECGDSVDVYAECPDTTMLVAGAGAHAAQIAGLEEPSVPCESHEHCCACAFCLDSCAP